MLGPRMLVVCRRTRTRSSGTPTRPNGRDLPNRPGDPVIARVAALAHPRESGGTVLALSSDSAVRVRPARSGDLKALAAVRRESWWVAYRALIPPDELLRLNDGRTVHRMAAALSSSQHRILLVEDRERGPVGYAWLGPHREGIGGHQGEILELYLHPAAQGHGLGRRLLVDGIWWLVDRGLQPVLVWVLAANPARHFYEACGGVRVGQGPVIVGGRQLLRVAYSWASSLPLPL
jgi:GNAT superfamily N-acetyltransferase